MKMLMLFPVVTRLGATLLLLSGAPVMAQPKPSLPNQKPDLMFKVVRKVGTCPQQIGLWTATRQYEGGGEHMVIADTWAIAAAPAKVVSATPQWVEYSAPLKRTFTSCVAQAGSDSELPYRFRFQQGKVFFQIDLRSINRNPSTPAAITYKAVLTSRPYVRWAIAD